MNTLQAIHEAYEYNYARLVQAVGTPKHLTYRRIERALEELCVETQKQLNIYIPNPCPISAIGDCRDCIGWYKRRDVIMPKKWARLYKQCRPDEEGARHCKLHMIAISGYSIKE